MHTQVKVLFICLNFFGLVFQAGTSGHGSFQIIESRIVRGQDSFFVCEFDQHDLQKVSKAKLYYC